MGEKHNLPMKYIYGHTNDCKLLCVPRVADEDELIDVEDVKESGNSQFDASKANTLMTECERHMKIVRPHPTRHNDEPIDR